MFLRSIVLTTLSHTNIIRSSYSKTFAIYSHERTDTCYFYKYRDKAVWSKMNQRIHLSKLRPLFTQVRCFNFILWAD